MKHLEDVLISPLISEKSFDRISDSNAYTFFVHFDANKPEIKRAVQQLFDVKVLSVNTMYRKGKKKRFGYILGQQSTKKIAIITLQEGDTIEAFGV
jgi:large subunit ribosomal protein L23|tara:strand:+ start:144 stop:431 length:288 start_codon:yes stop_codon:yes gene_type:complete